jgi:hypothetical protein
LRRLAVCSLAADRRTAHHRARRRAMAFSADPDLGVTRRVVPLVPDLRYTDRHGLALGTYTKSPFPRPALKPGDAGADSEDVEKGYLVVRRGRKAGHLEFETAQLPMSRRSCAINGGTA